MIEILPICRASFKCHIAVSFLSLRAYWGSTEFKINFVISISSYNNNEQWLLLLVTLCNKNCSYFHPGATPRKQKSVLFSFYLRETGVCMKFNLGNLAWGSSLWWLEKTIPGCKTIHAIWSLSCKQIIYINGLL